MSIQATHLLLTVTPTADIDSEELEELSRQLLEAILQSDAESVEPVLGAPAPAGAKGDPITLATLAVAIAPSAIEGLFNILRDWVARRRERASVTVREVREIVITGDASDEQIHKLEGFSRGNSTKDR